MHANLPIIDGKIAIAASLIEGMSYAYLIVSDGGKNIITELLAQDIDVAKQDIRLSESRPKGNIYSHERNVRFIAAGRSSTIANINSTQMCSIDSVKSALDALKLLNAHLVQPLTEWDFVAEWSELSAMDKLRKYDKYASHELNVLLYFKDRDFFDDVVARFIAHKTEKTLIDYYLLGDVDALQGYCKVPLIDQLNNLERSLLLLAMNDTNKEFCCALLDYIRCMAQVNVVPANKKRAAFDTVLNSMQSPKEGNNDDIPGAQMDNKTMSMRCYAAPL